MLNWLMIMMLRLVGKVKRFSHSFHSLVMDILHQVVLIAIISIFVNLLAIAYGMELVSIMEVLLMLQREKWRINIGKLIFRLHQ